MNDDNYIRFCINTKKLGIGSYINLYPLPCLHVGARQSDVLFIKQHLRKIKEDPNAKWIYLGDGGECVTKFSTGDVWEQLYNPQQQIDILLDLLRPIKEKGLFMVRGNHGKRVFKETGMSFDKTLALALGLPYLGVNAFCNLRINNASYDLYLHHGIDSGVSMQSKVNKAEQFRGHINTDSIITAHSHMAQDLSPAALLELNNHEQRVDIKLRYQYICGSGYDSRTGYAVEHGYSPLLPAFIVIKYSGKKMNGHWPKKQESCVFRSDGQHQVTGDYGIYKCEDG